MHLLMSFIELFCQAMYIHHWIHSTVIVCCILNSVVTKEMRREMAFINAFACVQFVNQWKIKKVLMMLLVLLAIKWNNSIFFPNWIFLNDIDGNNSGTHNLGLRHMFL